MIITKNEQERIITSKLIITMFENCDSKLLLQLLLQPFLLQILTMLIYLHQLPSRLPQVALTPIYPDHENILFRRQNHPSSVHRGMSITNH
jgi:hypothetical protein